MGIFQTIQRSTSQDEFRRRATEGVATWLSRLPGGVAAYISPGDDASAADRLHAFVRDRVTTNPVTRTPLPPVQIHLLELVLDAVDWSALVSDAPRSGRLIWGRGGSP